MEELLVGKAIGVGVEERIVGCGTPISKSRSLDE